MQGVIDSDGRRLESLSVVRVGHGDRSCATEDSQVNEMNRVIQLANLDYLVQENMKQHRSNDFTNKPFLKYIDIRKKVTNLQICECFFNILFFEDNGEGGCSMLHFIMCWVAACARCVLKPNLFIAMRAYSIIVTHTSRGSFAYHGVSV